MDSFLSICLCSINRKGEVKTMMDKQTDEQLDQIFDMIEKSKDPDKAMKLALEIILNFIK